MPLARAPVEHRGDVGLVAREGDEIGRLRELAARSRARRRGRTCRRCGRRARSGALAQSCAQRARAAHARRRQRDLVERAARGATHRARCRSAPPACARCRPPAPAVGPASSYAPAPELRGTARASTSCSRLSSRASSLEASSSRPPSSWQRASWPPASSSPRCARSACARPSPRAAAPGADARRARDRGLPGRRAGTAGCRRDPRPRRSAPGCARDRRLVAPARRSRRPAGRCRRLAKSASSKPSQRQVVLVVRQRQVDRHVACARLARAFAGSVSRSTICSGASIGPAPRISRARAVCSGVTK